MSFINPNNEKRSTLNEKVDLLRTFVGEVASSANSITYYGFESDQVAINRVVTLRKKMAAANALKPVVVETEAPAIVQQPVVQATEAPKLTLVPNLPEAGAEHDLAAIRQQIDATSTSASTIAGSVFPSSQMQYPEGKQDATAA